MWLALVAGCAIILAPLGCAATADAKSVSISDSISLHLVRKSGSTLIESGSASGTLAGSVSARFSVSALKVTGSVTIHPRGGGSLTINVVGYPRSAGTVISFSGTMGVRRGTGPYANATGGGSFTGTVNRRSWATSVSAKGKLTY